MDRRKRANARIRSRCWASLGLAGARSQETKERITDAQLSVRPPTVPWGRLARLSALDAVQDIGVVSPGGCLPTVGLSENTPPIAAGSVVVRGAAVSSPKAATDQDRG
jgi:hypothetical protein